MTSSSAPPAPSPEVNHLARLWRRSIRVRVATTTIALSVVLIGLVGWVLLRAVGGGLAENRTDVALSEARAGFSQAQSLVDATVETPGRPDSQLLVDLVDTLAESRGDSRTFEVVIEGPLGETAPAPLRSSSDLTTESLPDDLVEDVHTQTGVLWRYSSLAPLGAGEEEPVVVVGRRIAADGSGDEYAIFYVFSMSEQQSTLDLVRTALLWGGIALTAMVGVVAWLVARQVVDPLRLLRRIAERFASGDLDERIAVTGEDDIARLGTSFNQMAESLQSQISRLENLSVVQQRFVSDVSHELRTPLTTVQMAGEVLYNERDEFSPQARRASELLETELDRFEALLSDLLDLSRFDAGAAQLELEPVDFAQLARRVADDPAFARAGIAAKAVGSTRPAVVLADPRRVDRIVRNLVTNAIKYSGSNRVEIVVSRTPSALTFAMRDFGIGMSADERERVFDRFWRADPARSQGGTGLGLAIAREDAKLHHGTLEVFSRPGAGSEFVLSLPVRGVTALPPIDGEGPP